MDTCRMRPPHPDLRLRRYARGLEVQLVGLARPIARAQELHDGTWLAAVRPLQGEPERARILATEDEAVAAIRPWCRAHAWTYRPNVGNVPAPSAMGRTLPDAL